MKITTYEEKTFRIEPIEIKDTYVSKAIKKQKLRNMDCNYIIEAINDAFKCFCKADKKERLFRKNSRYFYDKKSVNILMKLLNEQDLIHPISFRNIGDNEHPCYEVNFKEVLDNTKPEEY